MTFLLLSLATCGLGQIIIVGPPTRNLRNGCNKDRPSCIRSPRNPDHRRRPYAFNAKPMVIVQATYARIWCAPQAARQMRTVKNTPGRPRCYYSNIRDIGDGSCYEWHKMGIVHISVRWSSFCIANALVIRKQQGVKSSKEIQLGEKMFASVNHRMNVLDTRGLLIRRFLSWGKGRVAAIGDEFIVRLRKSLAQLRVPRTHWRRVITDRQEDRRTLTQSSLASRRFHDEMQRIHGEYTGIRLYEQNSAILPTGMAERQAEWQNLSGLGRTRQNLSLQ
ncbi:hypothetical protein B0H13DRAFT_2483127 [Mycena leptocephala]|nr:hypothetical protein B0H13DRAFT_2483127 [Mycena leptocephala]